jgi:hypothetical protein
MTKGEDKHMWAALNEKEEVVGSIAISISLLDSKKDSSKIIMEKF